MGGLGANGVGHDTILRKKYNSPHWNAQLSRMLGGAGVRARAHGLPALGLASCGIHEPRLWAT